MVVLALRVLIADAAPGQRHRKEDGKGSVSDCMEGASVLPAVKGLVLAMLAREGRAARGSGPAAKAQRPCPPVRAPAC